MAWFVVAVFTLFSILTGLHATTICNGLQECFSENYTLTACELPYHNLMVVNVTSSIEVSDTSCTFFDDSYDNYNGTDGVYGFCEGLIWVDKGCRAHFSYCMSDESTSGVRNCSIDMFTTTTHSPPTTTTTTTTTATTTGISNTSNITTTTDSTSTQTSTESTNDTSPPTTTSNQTESENSTSPTPADTTLTTTNETDGEENSTFSTLMSVSSTSSTDASPQSSTEAASDGSSPSLTDTSSSATTTISTTRESTSDEDVWKIPVYVGIIIIVVVLAIFLGCGILLLYLLCSQRQSCRRYSKSLVDIRDETDRKTESLRRYHKEELDAAVKNRNAIGGIGEVKIDTNTYLTPVSGARFRAKGILEESVGYLDVTTEGKIGFINPRYKNKSSDGKDSETADAMVQSGTRKPAGQTWSNAKGLEQSGGYESINPVDVQGK